jgi:aerobic-type carbon monoxide dehydrogenase small subunit (CoxS/CutS family)
MLRDCFGVRVMAEISLKVNGRVHVLEVEPETPLLYVLRNDLGLRAAKFGCGLEQCGACTVLVGSETALSCKFPVERVGSREVTTLEGLATGDRLHPLQQAFVDAGAAQCGFCTPGMIMASLSLLAWNRDPSDTEIRRALADNLCRCGSHARILAAVRRAAEVMEP